MLNQELNSRPSFRNIGLIIFFISFILVGKSYSQVAIVGKVLDTHNRPIPYVNIGIFNKGIGTLSNEDGSFFIRIHDKYATDTLMFSALGFERNSIPLTDLKDRNTTITLKEKVFELKEVVITSKKIKPKTYELGNKYWQGPYGVSFTDTLYAGAAMALLINPATLPSYIENARLRIQKNSMGKFKVRLRLLEVDSLSGLPGEDMLHESVIVDSDINNKWLKLDLTQYHLEVNKPFFLVFEWIMGHDARKLLTTRFLEYAKLHPDEFIQVTKVINGQEITETEHGFHEGVLFGASAHPFSTTHYSCFYRTSSLAEWKKSIYIMAARITLSDSPPRK